MLKYLELNGGNFQTPVIVINYVWPVNMHYMHVNVCNKTKLSKVNISGELL